MQEALRQLQRASEREQRRRPTEFHRFEISFETSLPDGQQWSATIARSKTRDGWDQSATGTGETPEAAVENCLDVLECTDLEETPGW